MRESISIVLGTDGRSPIFHELAEDAESSMLLKKDGRPRFGSGAERGAERGNDSDDCIVPVTGGGGGGGT